MKHKYNFHKDLENIAKIDFKHIKLSPFSLEVINFFSRASNYTIKLGKDLKTTRITIPGYKSYDMVVNIYEPVDLKQNAPCIVYFHGGAFMTESNGRMHRIASYYALYAECKLFYVDYRLAPKYPFPIGVEDCYSSLVWVYDHADDLGINREKIAICGDSAGGTLAAAVTHIARDRNGPKICFQMLIYPATDIAQNTESMKKFTDTPIWNSNLNKLMWKKYLKDGDKGMIGYASPMSMERFDGLPDAFIEVEEYDCLRDEGINYGKRLQSFGNNVEINYIKGSFHGFDVIAGNKGIVKEAIKKRIEALRKAFY